MDINVLAQNLADVLGEDLDKIVTEGDNVVLSKPQAMALWAYARNGQRRHSALLDAAYETHALHEDYA